MFRTFKWVIPNPHTHTTWQSQATSYIFRKGIRLQEFEGVFVTVEISHAVAIIININRIRLSLQNLLIQKIQPFVQ